MLQVLGGPYRTCSKFSSSHLMATKADLEFVATVATGGRVKFLSDV